MQPRNRDRGGGYNVEDKAIGENGMTLADWDVVDPERTAEYRAEQQDEDPTTSVSLHPGDLGLGGGE
ncbi:hypothetical protein MPAR168_02785 [Methylorubrum populi]|uniref:Uncharacterized protein n=1 Tax=Methylobacterium radiotolerans TaxID=31998 RepID=A0ABU7TB81_9HYPH